MRSSRGIVSLVAILSILTLCACGEDSVPMTTHELPNPTAASTASMLEETLPPETAESTVSAADDFVLIEGGAFLMGSPADEAWRSDDEEQHEVEVGSFYISPYEVTQEEYAAVSGESPSTFEGAELPVENVSWLDAVVFANAMSELAGLEPAYIVEGTDVEWNRQANGYRLPTEAEWEYACRAGTTTPFNTQTSISAEEANYYGHYPYEIEENYFDQDNLTTKPGEYRQTTVEVDSFEPNAWGLYNMHGNVSEWTWDTYGEYDLENRTDPAGADEGTLHVYRGGGWNDFAKNLRSAYRAAMEADQLGISTGIRLVRNAGAGSGVVAASSGNQTGENAENVLIAFYSWGGNTRGIAAEIAEQTGAELFEITLVVPYSTDYNTVLDQAQEAQREQARPALASTVDNMDAYDTILLGYPNWWASIPMPIASFLESYDFSGKTIIPFCSHGGGRFGQSLTAIAKLVPKASMGEPLSVHYSGGSSLSEDVSEWLIENGIAR